MTLSQQLHEATPLILLPALDETIIRIVNENNGIKDTPLTLAVLDEISDIYSSTPAFVVYATIVRSIHQLIHSGRLIGIDCETPHGSFTMVLPAGTRPMIAMPIFVHDTRTRH